MLCFILKKQYLLLLLLLWSILPSVSSSSTCLKLGEDFGHLHHRILLITNLNLIPCKIHKFDLIAHLHIHGNHISTGRHPSRTDLHDHTGRWTFGPITARTTPQKKSTARCQFSRFDKDQYTLIDRFDVVFGHGHGRVLSISISISSSYIEFDENVIVADETVGDSINGYFCSVEFSVDESIAYGDWGGVWYARVWMELARSYFDHPSLCFDDF
mmetsp:Transcript_9897/g.14561  ORF Transcript_9897/g.14561 Transcript_9897/m.14561 type:complete len:214 (+) Transcript_9897:90-731(+)